jgi:N-acetylglucosaminyl-diphospho-decaprenol L-rhamnosyltransferase
VPACVDVIVVTYQSEACVGQAVASVRGAAAVRHIVVVDNDSADRSVASADAAGADAVLRNAENRGFAAAVNQGLARCNSDFVLLLNPDATLAAADLESLVAALTGTSAAVMAGPLLISADGEVSLGARRFSTATNRLLWHLPLPSRPQWSTPEYVAAAAMRAAPEPVSVDYLWGAALLVRRDFLVEIGGLDERFFLYSEDEDLGRQARARGRRSLLVPGASAIHVGGASTADVAAAQARVIVANAGLLRKWEGRFAACAYRWGVGPVLALRAAVLCAAGRPDEARLAARTRHLLPRRRASSRSRATPAVG